MIIVAGFAWFQRAKTAAQRLICCCPYHFGAKELFSAFSDLSDRAREECKVQDCPCKTEHNYETLDALCSDMLCKPVNEGKPHPLMCIKGKCGKCGFSKKWMTCPEEESAERRCSWRAFVKKTIDKRASDGTYEQTRLEPVRGSRSDFMALFRKELTLFIRHVWQAAWISGPGGART